MESERYLLTCMRYIELNPVRAAIVTAPEDYRWSSYRRHELEKGDEWLADHGCYLALGRDSASRRQAYQALFTDALLAPALSLIRSRINSSGVLGSDRFAVQIESLPGRRVRPGKPGRPRKETESTNVKH